MAFILLFFIAYYVGFLLFYKKIIFNSAMKGTTFSPHKLIKINLLAYLKISVWTSRVDFYID